MLASRRAWPLVAVLLLPTAALGAKKAKPGKSSAKLPDFPKEPADQAAARLWQAGELAASRGDYAWALKQFEGCLKAEPKNDGCKSGLAEARRRLGWNPKPKKKRKKPAPKPEEGEGEGADAKAEGGGEKPAAEGAAKPEAEAKAADAAAAPAAKP